MQEQPMNMVPGQQPVAPAPNPTPTSKNKIILLYVGLAVLVLAGAAMLYILLTKPSKTTQTTVTMPSASELSEAGVAALNKDELFWAYFKNAATQPKMLTTHAITTTLTKDAQPQYTKYYKVGFDYSNKKFVAAQDTLDAATNRTSKVRCTADGKEFDHLGFDSSQWTERSGDDKGFCKLGTITPYISDGMNTGGLTDEQADTMIAYIRKWQGLANVTDLKLVVKDGAKYLHFTFELRPIKSEGSYVGNQYLLWGFKEAGLDVMTHPYEYTGTFGGGKHVEYYVNAETQLPAYSQTTDIANKDATGQDVMLEEYTTARVLYDFATSSFDAEPETTKNITFNW